MGKNKSAADTLLRQWHTLRAIPRHPAKIEVNKLRTILDTAGFQVTARTIQRDLIELSTLFPLTSDERERPYGWSWQGNAPTFNLPNLSNQEALAFAMIEHYLRPLLPHALLDQLKPYFGAAKKRLASDLPKHGSMSWLGKVAVVQPNQALIPPKIDADAQAVVTDALLSERRVRIRYRKKGERKDLEYVLSPLALVQRGPITYIRGSVADYTDVLTFALHRIQHARVLDEVVKRPKGFSLNADIVAGTMNFGAGGHIRLDAVFDRAAAEHLYETPLSEDQRLTEVDEKRVRLQATVADTRQLRWWLLAFGDGVEVRAPAALRVEFVSTVAAMAAAYSQ